MKKSFKLSLALIMLSILCLFVISCGGEKSDPNTGIIVSSDFNIVDDTYELNVESTVANINLLAKIQVADGATIAISKTEAFTEELNGESLELKYGSNVFYVKVTDRELEQTYRFEITRTQLLTVKFNTDGGSEIEDVLVESGTIIDIPQSIKTGYELSWDYNFDIPITSDTTINAIWTPNEYQITIKDEDKVIETIDVVFDGEYSLSDIIPEKLGYRFNGFYYKESDVELPFEKEGDYTKAQDIIVYTKYEPIEYSITYVVEKGAIHQNKTSKFTIKDKINLSPAEWSNDERYFVGWYTSEDFNENSKITSISNRAENITLWAKFQDRVFNTTVNFFVNGAKIDTKEFTYKSNYELTSPTEDKGYKFAGWAHDGEIIDIQGVWQYKDKSIDLIAEFTPIENNIIYNLPQGATTTNPLKYNVEMGEITLSDAVFGNNIFQGWFLDANYNTPIEKLTIDNVTSGMTLYSKWLYVSNVVFNSNEGSCDTAHATFNFGKEYALPTAEKKGYVFVGWYYGDTELESNGTWPYKLSDVELVAKYEPRMNDIEYRLPQGATNNSNNPSEYNVEMGSIVLENPTFGNNIFQGWYLDFSCTIEIKELNVDNVTDEMTLYSKWQYVTDVTFNADGGSSEKTEDTFQCGKEYTLPSAEKLGYTFLGWYYGETELEAVGTWPYKDAEIELVAKYLLNEYDITYVLPNGASADGNTVTYTVELGTVVLNKPTFGDHIFQGWYLDADYKTPITELTIDNVTSDMTIYSKWQYVSNVVFDTEGATEKIENEQFMYGQAFTLPIPIKSGCLFGGWYYGDVKVIDGNWQYKEDITLVANWIPTTIAVNYELNGGTQNTQNPQTFDVYTGIIVLKNPTHSNQGFTFAGWYTDIDFKNKITQIDTATVREITLYAKWTGVTVSVTLDPSSGYVSSTELNLVYGSAYSLPIPERVGYKFDGWYDGDTKISNTGIWNISSNVSLVAKWTLEKYKIDFDLGDATLSDIYTIGYDSNGDEIKVPVTFVKEYDVNSDDIIIPQVKRDGYIFLGWKSNAGTYQNITLPTGSTGNRSYKAIWCKDTNEDGFVFAYEDGHMACIGFVSEPTSAQRVDMPSQYEGYPVTVIKTNAFSNFGVAFGNSSYKDANYYFTITIPKNITTIQTDAFANCYGICISLRDDNDDDILDFQSADELKEWETTVNYGTSKIDKQTRDCIWGFRPAIGWTRFSAVEIPDDYE